MNPEEKKLQMEALVRQLNEAAKAYYAENREIMSDHEYDRLYDQLEALEKETGICLSGSPTLRVGYEAVDSLPKEKHVSPMLSLAKTKSREELAAWLGGQEGVLSWKEDGLTVVLTYREGKLVKCVTRGNGEIGEVVTNNARHFERLPLQIPYKGELVLRGEAVIGYRDFARINEGIPETDAKYKNPRNLCSGSVRQLDSAVTAKRNVHVMAFALVSADPMPGNLDTYENRLAFLEKQGFETVEHVKVDKDSVVKEVEAFAEKITDNDIPSDGLVLAYNDLKYAESLGRTAKFPRGAIAFKWADEMAETVITEVEWNTSRTGLIAPVAVFEPVELEGTTVSRASVHNVSVIRKLRLGIGDRVKVYKANMIIPQIAENLTSSDSLELPEHCPVCGSPTELRNDHDTEVLYCTNADCTARKLKSFVHFTQRDAMNIEGLSEATLEKLIGIGVIHSFADIYRLQEHRDKILSIEGFQSKSCDKLLESIDKSRETTAARILFAVGISGVGSANGKMVAAHFDDDFDRMLEASEEEFAMIDGVGTVMAASLYQYLHKEEKREALKELLSLVNPVHEESSGDQSLKGMSFVITGSLVHYGNRSELKAEIEAMGGKVSGSVSSKTTALINNDVTSGSSKNKSARELGIRIISEDDFIREYLKQEK